MVCFMRFYLLFAKEEQYGIKVKSVKYHIEQVGGGLPIESIARMFNF